MKTILPIIYECNNLFFIVKIRMNIIISNQFLLQNCAKYVKYSSAL